MTNPVKYKIKLYVFFSANIPYMSLFTAKHLQHFTFSPNQKKTAFHLVFILSSGQLFKKSPRPMTTQYLEQLRPQSRFLLAKCTIHVAGRAVSPYLLVFWWPLRLGVIPFVTFQTQPRKVLKYEVVVLVGVVAFTTETVNIMRLCCGHFMKLSAC